MLSHSVVEHSSSQTDCRPHKQVGWTTDTLSFYSLAALNTHFAAVPDQFLNIVRLSKLTVVEIVVVVAYRAMSDPSWLSAPC